MTSQRHLLTRILGSALTVLALSRCASVPIQEAECRVILVIPPFHPDEIAANEIMDVWTRYAKRSLGSCDSFVPRHMTGTRLEFLRMTNLYLTRPRHVRSNAKVLVKEFGASHAVLLNLTMGKSSVIVTPALISLRSRRTLVDPSLTNPVSMVIRRPDLIQPSWTRRLGLAALGFLPTTVAVGFSDPPNFREERSRHKNLGRVSQSYIPPLLSGIYANSPLHPDEMSLFDFTPRLVGSAALLNRDEIHRYRSATNSAPPDDPNRDLVSIYSMKAILFAPTAGGEIALHTPLGTTSFGMEMGLGIGWSSTSLDPSRFHFPFITKVGFSHRVFFTDRLVGEFAVSDLTFDKPIIDDEYMILAGRHLTTFTIGYFFPEVRGVVRHTAM